MKYRGVIFDLDGTLLDTIEDLTDSMNAALGELGFAPRTVDECKFFVGDGRDAFAGRALGESHQDDATVARCVSLMSENYRQNWGVKTCPYEGIPELLGALSGIGISMAVLSNKYDESVKMMVGHFFGGVDFRIVRGALAAVRRKPDPAAAVAIAVELGIDPGEFLYLGDTDTDMRTAVAAGMHPVGVLWGFRPREELIANGAGTLIERPSDLLRLISEC